MKRVKIGKKILSLILVFGLAFNPICNIGQWGSEVFAAPVTLNENMFAEGDFEESLSPMTTNGSGTQSITTDASHTGTQSLYVVGTGGRATVYNFEAGATYRMTFWTKAATEGAAWQIKIHRWQSDWFSAASALTVNSGCATSGTTENGWTEWSYDFEMLKDSSIIQFDAGTSAAASAVYFDDISIVKIAEAPQAGLTVLDGDAYVVEREMNSAPRTFEFWLETTGTPTGYLVSNYETQDLSEKNNYGASYGVHFSNGHPMLWWWAGSGQGPQIRLRFDNVTLPVNERVHMTVVSDGNTGEVYCYVNGELKQTISVDDYKKSEFYSWGGASFKDSFAQIKTETITHDIGATRPLIVGGYCNDTSKISNVKLYSMALYEDARSAEAVALDMERVEYSEDTLKLAYDFTDVGNERLEDHSNESNHLTYAKDYTEVYQYEQVDESTLDTNEVVVTFGSQDSETWKLLSNQLSKMTAKYYKVQASVDNADAQDILIQKYDDHLCIWVAGFFNGPSGTNGFGVPDTNFTIAKGAAFIPMQYDNGWTETGAESIMLANDFSVVYEGDTWVDQYTSVSRVKTDMVLAHEFVRESDNHFAFKWASDTALTGSSWYTVEATIGTENGTETRNVLLQVDGSVAGRIWIYSHCFNTTPSNSLLPTKSFYLAKGAKLVPLTEANASSINSEGHVYYLSQELSLVNNGTDATGWQDVSSPYDDSFDETGLALDINENYITSEDLTSVPLTYEAEINLPKELGSDSDCANEYGGVILGNYAAGYNKNTAIVNFEVHTDGHPALFFNQKGKSVRIVFDEVDVRTSEWMHLAVTVDPATYEVKCYVDGELKQTESFLAATGTTQKEFPTSTEGTGWRKFVVGGDYRHDNSKYFMGEIRSVATYYDIRTPEEVMADSNAMTSLSDDQLAQSYNLTYDNYGTLTRNQLWKRNVDRPSADEYDYSMIAIGDTQIVSYFYQEDFPGIYDYVLQRAQEDEKLAFCMGLGDITEKGAIEWEWQQAYENIHKMDGVVPYSLIRGNHEYDPYMVKYFPYEDYKDQLQGSYDSDSAHTNLYQAQGIDGGSILNNWQTFTAGNTNWLLLGLDYFPTAEELAWAKDVVDSHPNHNVILTTHAFLYVDGERETAAKMNNLDAFVKGGGENSNDEVWTELVSQCDNIKLVLCGHESASDVVTTTFEREGMSDVTAMLIDPQGLDKALGATAIVTDLYFDELDDGTANVTVRHYSTARQEYYGSAINQFTTNISLVAPVTVSNTENTITAMQFEDKVVATNPSLNDQINVQFAGNISAPAGTKFSGKIIDAADNSSLNVTLQIGDSNTLYIYIPNSVCPETFKIAKDTVFTSYDLTTMLSFAEEITVETKFALGFNQVDTNGWRLDSNYMTSASEFYQISSVEIDGSTVENVKVEFFNWGGDRGAYIYSHSNFFPSNSLPVNSLVMSKGTVFTQCDSSGNLIADGKTMTLDEPLNVTLVDNTWTEQKDILTVGGGNTKTDAVTFSVKDGGTLPIGYHSGKFISGWKVGDDSVTTYDASKGTDAYVADFVDTKMLDVKVQDNSKTAGEGATRLDVRFIASVNDLDYEKAGFVFSLKNEIPTVGGKNCIDRSTTTVYKNLLADGQSQSVTNLYDAYSDYMYAFEILQTPVNTPIYTRAYVELTDGTIVYGDVRMVTAPVATE